MSPQVIPMTNVYVHGKLVEAVRHYLLLSGRKVPRSLHKIKVEDFGSIALMQLVPLKNGFATNMMR